MSGLDDVGVDGDDPVGGVEILGVLCRVAFVGAEFVEIVVMGDVCVGILLFGSAKGALGEAGEFCGRKGGLRWESKVEQAFACRGSRASNSHGLQEFAAVQVDRLGGDGRIRQIWTLADQHLVPPHLLGRFCLTLILCTLLSVGIWAWLTR